MGLLINILLVFYVIIALLMILIILMQRPKSEGLGAAFGGGVTENIFGAQTTNVLTKITSWLASIFFLLTFGLSILYAHKDVAKSNLQQELMKNLPTPVPGSPTPGATAAGAIEKSPTPSASETGTPTVTATPLSSQPSQTPMAVLSSPTPAATAVAQATATPVPEASSTPMETPANSSVNSGNTSTPTAAPSSQRRRRHR
jgi:preprotein translocase subunit SecG